MSVDVFVPGWCSEIQVASTVALARGVARSVSYLGAEAKATFASYDSVPAGSNFDKAYESIHFRVAVSAAWALPDALFQALSAPPDAASAREYVAYATLKELERLWRTEIPTYYANPNTSPVTGELYKINVYLGTEETAVVRDALGRMYLSVSSDVALGSMRLALPSLFAGHVLLSAPRART